MVRRRALLRGLLVVLHLALIEAACFSTFDVASSPSYFDDDGDDDSLPQVTKRIVLVTVDVLPPIRVSVTGAPVVLLESSARSLRLPALSRLRAPPPS
jgi:hypothetical protein